MVTVRTARPEEIEYNLLPLARAFYSQTRQSEWVPLDEENLKQFLATLIETKWGAVLVAESDTDGVVGVAGGICMPFWMNPSHMTGQELFWYVRKDYRRTKTGGKLFEALEKWARDEVGADSFSMVALSHLHERRVGNMYEQKGYVPLERVYIKEF